MNPSPCPILTAHRIVLKPIQIEDSKQLFAMWNSKCMSELAGIEKSQNIDAIKETIKYFMTMNLSGFFLKWAIRDKTTDEFIGEIEFYPLKPRVRPWQESAIGYSLKEMARGKGFMSEAVEAVLNYGFTELAVLRVKADVPEKNVKSLKLLRKNRFVYEGMQVNKLLVNNEFKNMSLLAITKARYFEGQISI